MCPTASISCAGPAWGSSLITHYQRLLNYIIPDYVHVMIEGRIVRSGNKSLALELIHSGEVYLKIGGRCRISNAASPNDS